MPYRYRGFQDSIPIPGFAVVVIVWYGRKPNRIVQSSPRFQDLLYAPSLVRAYKYFLLPNDASQNEPGVQYHNPLQFEQALQYAVDGTTGRMIRRCKSNSAIRDK